MTNSIRAPSDVHRQTGTHVTAVGRSTNCFCTWPQSKSLARFQSRCTTLFPRRPHPPQSQPEPPHECGVFLAVLTPLRNLFSSEAKTRFSHSLFINSCLEIPNGSRKRCVIRRCRFELAWFQH